MKGIAAGFALWLAATGASFPVAAAVERDVEVEGARIRVAVHAPVGPVSGAVVLAHGFLRSPATLGGHAQALAADGHLAVVPELPSRVDSRANGRALRGLIARIREGALGPRIDRVVLVGFSAGGLSAILAAAAPGVVGYVGLDAFDRPGGAGREAARALQAPAVLLSGPAAFCNAYNISAPWREALPNLLRERRIEGASHCDFEFPTDGACTLACGRAHPDTQEAIRALVREAVRDMLPRLP
jgi:pimeloyl-ACP methyl ester carboxylesterase